MQADDPAVRDVLRRSMVARIATLSRTGQPSVTPLYFVWLKGHVWLGTADWTLAARDAKADPRVCVLLNVEENPNDRRLLRIAGRAVVRTDAETQRAYVLRVAFKYSLRPSGIRNQLAHFGQFSLVKRYRAQSAVKGLACVIDVAPEQFEILNDQLQD